VEITGREKKVWRVLGLALDGPLDPSHLPHCPSRLSCCYTLSSLPFSGSVEAAVPPGFTDALIAGSLNMPTAMEFSPDGRIFVSEKDGDLRVIKNGALLSQPFVSLSVNSVGERGLLGIAFDPNFTSNGYVYVYYTTASDPIHNRVSRLTADPANPDRALAGSEVHILDLEPVLTESHNGGALEFGPDGKLYVSVGDNYYQYHSQSLTSRFGKILRINADGSIPTDNPFYNVQGAYREIWAMGLRNPFTFQFSGDGSNKMYIADVGQFEWEEINRGLAGANYGWPACEGPCDDPQFVNPIYSYAHPTDGSGASITGGPFYEAGQFPREYQGSYFFGDYVQGFIKRLTPTNQVVDFASAIGTVVAMEVGPDGSLYYLTIFPGEVRRITYGTPGNAFPTAMASASPTSGQPPLSVTFSGSGSSDPDSDALTYSWDFGDGSTANGVSVSHTYSTAGLYPATLTVDDSRGGSDTDTVNITVGNPPVATINSPASGATYNAGDAISFSGSATDEEDGILPASAFHWTVLFHHNTHTHPFQQYNGVTSGTFTIPTTGETDHDVWYRIYLTVTDSDGLTHTTTRDILPNKSTITLASNVSGLQLLLDGQPRTTPYSFVGVVGISRTLEAPSSQNLSGTIYNYESWSDGGSRIRTIATPAADTTFTADYSSGGTAPERSLTVHGIDFAGNVLNMYTTVSLDGSVIATGFTPFTFTGTEGVTYTVGVQDYGGATFDHWENGSIVRERSLTLNIDTEITAFYRTADDPPTSTYNLSVRSADMSGNAISGYYTVISSDGNIVSDGYTPLTYIGQPGQTYTVTISDYGDAFFDHWEDGSTSRTRNVTLNTNLVLTAYFSIGAPPSPSEYELMVTSTDMSGNTITGYYTTISSDGTTVETALRLLPSPGAPALRTR
jgi:glucose/arabinose dehydrogenase/chitodextrinase